MRYLILKQLNTSKQAGSVLVIGLLLLLVVTLLVLATMSLPAVEIKMAHNAELQTQALLTAEDSLSIGEREIMDKYNGVPTFNFDQDKSDCLYNGSTAQDDQRCKVAGGTPTFFGQYQVEYLGPQPLEFGNGATMTNRYYFHVTGRGHRSSSLRQLQTTFATPTARAPK